MVVEIGRLEAGTPLSETSNSDDNILKEVFAVDSANPILQKFDLPIKIRFVQLWFTIISQLPLNAVIKEAQVFNHITELCKLVWCLPCVAWLAEDCQVILSPATVIKEKEGVGIHKPLELQVRADLTINKS